MNGLRRVSRHISKHCRRFGAAQAQIQPLVASGPSIKVGDLSTKLFIDGNFVDSVSGKTFDTIDPRNEEVITKVAEAQAEDIDKAVKAARRAFDSGVWTKIGGFERSKVLWKLADLVERDMEILKQMETWDNGKPLSFSQIDMTLAVEHLRYFAGWADKIHGKTIPCNTGAGRFFAYTLHEPIGVAGAIIPWNFPLLMAVWKMAPCLATGCSIVIKSCEYTPLTSLHLAKLCAEAGVPPGVVNILPGFGETAGASLAGHPDIDKIGFTGETGTGSLVMAAAAKNVKPITLELGGKSPSIIFADADIDSAVDAHQVGLFLNQGQCCCASSRIYVEESKYDEFVEKTVEASKKRKIGDPFTDVDQGPQQNEEQFKKVLQYMESGKSQGADLLLGGERVGDKGYYVDSTIFGNVTDDMDISRDEIFGPVMQIAKFDGDIEKVLRRANDTSYGLAAGVFTKDIDKANYVSRALKAGTVWVNCYDIFDAGLPFGGYKKSGIGREKGEYALENYTEVKTIVQNLPNDGGWY